MQPSANHAALDTSRYELIKHLIERSDTLLPRRITLVALFSRCHSLLCLSFSIRQNLTSSYKPVYVQKILEYETSVDLLLQ